MHSNSEGNSPSLKAQLGVGWNRALPAPFGFDKAFVPDQVNDYLTCIGGSLVAPYNFSASTTITIEFWMKVISTGNGYRCMFEFADIVNSLNNGFAWLFNYGDGAFVTCQYTAAAYGIADTVFQTPTGNPIYCVLTFDKTTKYMSLWINNITFYTTTFPATIQQIDVFTIGARYNATQVNNGNIKYDEMRIYKGAIGADERTVNYNLGMGNNPARSENLIAWWDFNAAESDSSLWPGGLPTGWSAGAWGVRDKTPSGNNHLMQVNMANNATLGGALATW